MVRVASTVGCAAVLLGILSLMGAITFAGFLFIADGDRPEAEPRMFDVIALGTILVPGVLLSILAVYSGVSLSVRKTAESIKVAAACVAAFGVLFFGPYVDKALEALGIIGIPISLLFAMLTGISLYAWLASEALRQEGFGRHHPLSLLGRKAMVLVSLVVFLYSGAMVRISAPWIPGYEELSGSWQRGIVYSFSFLVALSCYLCAMKFLGKYRSGCPDASPPDGDQHVHSIGNEET